MAAAAPTATGSDPAGPTVGLTLGSEAEGLDADVGRLGLTVMRAVSLGGAALMTEVPDLLTSVGARGTSPGRTGVGIPGLTETGDTGFTGTGVPAGFTGVVAVGMTGVGAPGLTAVGTAGVGIPAGLTGVALTGMTGVGAPAGLTGIPATGTPMGLAGVGAVGAGGVIGLGGPAEKGVGVTAEATAPSTAP